MWNRQREAQMAREILAEVGDDAAAPNRNPPEAVDERRRNSCPPRTPPSDESLSITVMRAKRSI